MTQSPQMTTPAVAAPGPDALVERAYALSKGGAPAAGSAGSAGSAVDDLIAAAGDRRKDMEAARDLVAARVRARVDDFEATAALQLLNRALSKAPIHDPLDWRVRWTQRFRRP